VSDASGERESKRKRWLNKKIQIEKDREKKEKVRFKRY
jgi:hypothetical protein